MRNEDEELEEYYRQQEEEVKQEILRDSPVYQECGYVSFVSKSKGRRKNGTQRLRRNWKEVDLFRRSRGWHLEHNFPFDEEVSELLGDHTGAEELREQMMDICRPNGGTGRTDDWQFRLAVRGGMRKTKGYRFHQI